MWHSVTVNSMVSSYKNSENIKTMLAFVLFQSVEWMMLCATLLIIYLFMYSPSVMSELEKLVIVKSHFLDTNITFLLKIKLHKNS